jgi:methylenetetrahydrofolate reductase (NADPH)
MDCVWTRIEKKKKDKAFKVHLPPDPELLNTASYVNLINGKDRETRVPKDPVDTSHIPAGSALAEKMHRGEFVVTLEIASPLTRDGLPRVERMMQRVADHVDAVNTTTNAGGVPSLHSTETARVVQDHGVEPIIQFCGRDHHREAFLQELDRAMDMGYRNFLCLTGDWLPQTERKIDQQTWFPMDSSQMIHFANAELSAFRDRHGAAPYLGVAANPFSIPMPVSVDRLRLKREAGARFCQTQAITHVPTFREWYRQVREGRENAPRLTIPSIPLVGSRKAFEILCRLPGIYVDDSLRNLVEEDDFQRKSLEWAFDICEGVVACGAAGVHTMNFGMPPDLIDEFLLQIRDRAAAVRA